MKYEGSFLSEVDQLEISVLAYIPDEKPYRGVIQLVHGMCEYKERYIPFMEYLKDKGYVSVIHDHRGHGKSIKSIEDLGYMYGGGAEAIISDMRTINRGIHERFPDIPVILFGHSMGSLAVRAYTSAYDRTIDALIVCGSPSKNSALPFAKFLAKTEGRIRGEKHRSKLLTALSLGSYAAKFRKEGYKNAWLCSDPGIIEGYEKSDFCGFMFTDDAYLSLFCLMEKAYDQKKWLCTNSKLPVLFISGAEDPCMTNVRKFAQAVRLMRNIGYKDVKGKLYPGMRHEILNEREKERVYSDVCTFINKKIK